MNSKCTEYTPLAWHRDKLYTPSNSKGTTASEVTWRKILVPSLKWYSYSAENAYTTFLTTLSNRMAHFQQFKCLTWRSEDWGDFFGGLVFWHFFLYNTRCYITIAKTARFLVKKKNNEYLWLLDYSDESIDVAGSGFFLLGENVLTDSYRFTIWLSCFS